MLIPCEGRPATARGVGYPPLELMVGGGVEVLVERRHARALVVRVRRAGALTMRRLLLLRHAKSSWDQPGLADHDRQLSPRGHQAAIALREHLRDSPSLT